MKILLTIDFPPETGGIQRYLYDRAKHLYLKDDIVIVGRRKRNDSAINCSLQCIVKFCTIPFSGLDKKWALFAILIKLCGIIIKCKKTINIEAGNVFAAIPVYLLSIITKKYPYTVYCYGKELLPLQKNTFKARFLRSVINKASERYVLTKYTAELLKKAGIKGSWVLAPPKIDLPLQINGFKKVENSQFSILTVGRLVHHKGHGILIDAVVNIEKEIPWTLTIAGNGPEYETLILKIKKYGLTNRIFIKKELTNEQIANEYKAADLFVFPSLELKDGVEGFGIVLLEAMAYSIPVIGTDTGGIPEVLCDECGLLVKSGNADLLCNAIKKMYNDRSLREKIALNGNRKVKEYYSWK